MPTRYGLIMTEIRQYVSKRKFAVFFSEGDADKHTLSLYVDFLTYNIGLYNWKCITSL